MPFLYKNQEIIIQRSNYLNQIKGFIDKPLIKIITGLRRSGKTEILKMVCELIRINTNDDHIIYMNFEDFDWQDIVSFKELNAYLKSKMIDSNRYYIFLDEIQIVNNLEKTVNALRLRNTDVYITGSNSKIMSDELATLLGGRTITFRINTLSFVEFMEFRKKFEINFKNEMDELDAFINIGGFPMLSIKAYSESDARKLTTEINNSALLRDVVIRHKIKMPQLLDRIVAFIYDNVGNQLSISSIVNYLKNTGRKTDYETIGNYLKYLEDAFIIKKAQRYDIKGKQLLETNNKYYLSDHSLQYVIRERRPDKIQGVLENIVYMDLIRRGYLVYVGKYEDKEIDFIAEELNGENRIYVQVCYFFSSIEIIKREFSPLISIQDNYLKFVVTLDKNWKINENGVQGIHLLDFLKREEF